MRKAVKFISAILAITMLLSITVFTGLTASAAYVTDGDGIYLAGDVNEDGEVNVLDLVKANIGGDNTAAADLDGDATVGKYDYALIRAMILGIDNSQWTE